MGNGDFRTATFSCIVSPVTRYGVDYLRRAVRERVEKEGLRPFSARTGIPLGQLRSLLQGRAARSTTLELMSSVLGLEFYIGPTRRRRLGRPSLPPEIAKALHLPKEADVADAIRVIDKDTMASKLREGVGVVQGLVEQAASAAALLPELVSGEYSSGEGVGPEEPVVVIPLVADAPQEPSAAGVTLNKSSEVSIAVATEALADWAQPERLMCFRAAGDAMEPTIHSGDLVAVDTGRRTPEDDELFVLRIESGLVVRRLHQTGRHWFVTSDNPAFLSHPLADRDDIVGQVAWCEPHGNS